MHFEGTLINLSGRWYLRNSTHHQLTKHVSSYFRIRKQFGLKVGLVHEHPSNHWPQRDFYDLAPAWNSFKSQRILTRRDSIPRHQPLVPLLFRAAFAYPVFVFVTVSFWISMKGPSLSLLNLFDSHPKKSFSSALVWTQPYIISRRVACFAWHDRWLDNEDFSVHLRLAHVFWRRRLNIQC